MNSQYKKQKYFKKIFDLKKSIGNKASKRCFQKLNIVEQESIGKVNSSFIW